MLGCMGLDLFVRCHVLFGMKSDSSVNLLAGAQPAAAFAGSDRHVAQYFEAGLEDADQPDLAVAAAALCDRDADRRCVHVQYDESDIGRPA